MSIHKDHGRAATLLSLTLFLAACGGGGGGGTQLASTAQGVFLDSAVEGLRYETESLDGVTDAQGTFEYASGEEVSFFLGDILLGSAPGGAVLTPIDLVPGTDSPLHPQVTNIIRFLQTLDDDAQAANGIRILADIADALQGQNIDFDVATDDFENDIQGLITTVTGAHLGGPRTLVPAVVAQNHLAQTLAGQAPVNGGGGGGGEQSLSIAGDPSIGTTFTPNGPVFPMITQDVVAIHLNSTPGANQAVIGVGAGFARQGQAFVPVSASLVWQSPNQTRTFTLLCSDGDCSGLSIDVDERELTFDDVTIPPAGPGNPITLNGTLTF